MTQAELNEFIETLERDALERVDMCSYSELQELEHLFDSLEVILNEILNKLKRTLN